MLYYLNLMISNPIFLVSSLLILGVIFVNGWTDAPNAIATAVATRAMKVKTAIFIAAIFNFLGVFTMCMINNSVAMTIYNIADFNNDPHYSLIALCAAMSAIVIWALAAWYFGIPTSESHALISGLSGAAIALTQSFSSIRLEEWYKVIIGIVLSIGLGFVLAILITKIIVLICKNKDRFACTPYFLKLQIVSSAAMAFMHGAQDGQKFIAVFLLTSSFALNQTGLNVFEIPIWMMALCSFVMAIGTSIGGHRIIRSIGMDMVKLKPYQGVSADIASIICLVISTLFGLPVSTTHTKTASILGVGAYKGIGQINIEVVKDLVYAWIFTFPGCGILGFIMARLYLMILG